MPLVLKMLGNGRVCGLRAAAFLCARGLKRHIQPEVQGPRAAMARAAANSSLACLWVLPFVEFVSVVCALCVARVALS
jgi:hypothetical protein